MAHKELSSTKLYIDVLETKKNKLFVKKLNRIGPVMDTRDYLLKITFSSFMPAH